jgi:hypothetical protein
VVNKEKIQNRETLHLKGEVSGEKLNPLIGSTLKPELMYRVDIPRRGCRLPRRASLKPHARAASFSARYESSDKPAGVSMNSTFMGKVSDIAGRRIVYLVCLVTFFVGSWLVATSPDWPAGVAL